MSGQLTKKIRFTEGLSVERPLIFAFQNEIARMVSTAMSVRMATEAPAPGGTRNAAAYEAYLRGRALYDRQGRGNGSAGARELRIGDRRS